MKIVRLLTSALRGPFWIAVALLLQPCAVHADLEQTFDMLQIGTTTYRNVTVTTKSKNYVFLLHSAGMTNIKVADLSPELRSRLGYDVLAAPKTPTNTAAWARQTLSKLEVPEVKSIENRLQSWCRIGSAPKLNVPALAQKDLIIAGAVLLALYLFHCYCCLLICQKTGSQPGALVWVPVLQLFPLLKAAGMPPLWFLGFLIPGVNLVAQVVWYVKITQARGKSFWVALFLIFPLTSAFAALYLAFSGSARAKKAERRVEIMTLEAA